MLLVGIVIGALGSAFYTGMRSGESGRLGSGFKQLLEVPRIEVEILAPTPPDVEPARTTFDFFTVLPDERVIPESVESSETEAAIDAVPNKDDSVKSKYSNGYYMLQVAQYTEEEEADRLKVELAKSGFASSIQHISVQGQSDFYRVRIGPFFSMRDLEKVNRELTRKGIDALPLKVSRP